MERNPGCFGQRLVVAGEAFDLAFQLGNLGVKKKVERIVYFFERFT
jgi:hypothetical protein